MDLASTAPLVFFTMAARAALSIVTCILFPFLPIARRLCSPKTVSAKLIAMRTRCGESPSRATCAWTSMRSFITPRATTSGGISHRRPERRKHPRVVSVHDLDLGAAAGAANVADGFAGLDCLWRIERAHLPPNRPRKRDATIEPCLADCGAGFKYLVFEPSRSIAGLPSRIRGFMPASLVHVEQPQEIQPVAGLVEVTLHSV